MATKRALTAERPARLEFTAGDGDGSAQASGDWVIGGLDDVDRIIRNLGRAKRPSGRIIVSKIGRLDTAGAWLLHLSAKTLGTSDAPWTIEGASDNQRVLLDAAAKNEPEHLPAMPVTNPVVDAIARLGRAMATLAHAAYEMFGFSGLIIQVAGRVLTGKGRLRMNSVVHHLEAAGFDAVPIISLMSFLIGAVISFMSGDILKDYGGQIFAVDLISFSFFREFGVLLAAIMVAGRSGSAFTAEIGAMKSHEEIDAMRSLALDPIEILVIPRVLALILALPALTFISDIMGLVGGGLADWATLGITPSAFVNRLVLVTDINQFNVGMIKAPVFAFLVAMIGCYQGFKVTGTAESVGERTTLSVVQSIFVVIVYDALFALFFQEINY